LASPQPLLVVSGVEAGYGKKVILQGVDFTVHRGEVVALLGANGSGKSTALNTVSGFVRPSAGSIRLGDEEIAGEPPHRTFRRGVVQVSQGRDLFPDLTVEDNLRLGAIMRQNKSQLEEDLDRIYGYFPRLLERRRQQVRTLSGGEQQMVAIGRALMSRPRIMLLDEPSGGLSPRFMAETGAIMRRLKETGTTMLLVEQNITLALTVADRYVILRDGKVIEGGPVSGLAVDREEIVKTIYL
jgi:branched-chain amino acid transport system ATP-binding protein